MFCHVRKGWHFPIFLLNGWGTTTRCNSKEIPHDEKATNKRKLQYAKNMQQTF
jgi:hypothetical protein